MKRLIVPLLVIVAGFGVAALLIATGPKLEPRAPETMAPTVRVQTVVPTRVPMTVIAYGTVKPRTESELVPEVSGRVISVSDSLVTGGFFSKGQLLMSIEKLDYESAVDQAKAGIARAESEHSIATKNYQRLVDLGKKQSASESQQDDALNRMKIAAASLAEAKSRLLKAQRDLERTQIFAPFDGRVRTERVDVGQFASRGVSLGTLYATDYAEVVLPINDEEMSFLNLSLDAQQAPDAGNQVTLTADFAGKQNRWVGNIVRTEGELDPKTRMINLIARIDAPYESASGQPPLAVGLFVRAEIHGKDFDQIVAIPRPALRGNQVLIVDKDQRLRFRAVDILRIVEDTVYIKDGLSNGELVCLSPIDNVVEGMPVRTVNAAQQDEQS